MFFTAVFCRISRGPGGLVDFGFVVLMGILSHWFRTNIRIMSDRLCHRNGRIVIIRSLGTYSHCPA